jgi:hypothetical protein
MKWHEESERKFAASRRKIRKIIEERDLINDPSAWREALKLLDEHIKTLTPWERDFITGLHRFESLSPRQHAVLRRMLFTEFSIPKGRRKR